MSISRPAAWRGSISPQRGTAMPVLPILGIMLVYLKLTHVIAWSWLWVTLPFWGFFAIVLAGLFIFGWGVILVAIVAGVFAGFKRRARLRPEEKWIRRRG
jgi:hypothetical protein